MEKEDKKIEPKYQNDAKLLIDSMFDCKLFHNKITRDDMNEHENLLAFIIQSNAESMYRIAEFTAKYKDK